MPSTTSEEFSIHTALERPDLFQPLHDSSHPLNAAWPDYIDHDSVFQKYIPALSEDAYLANFQYLVLHSGEPVALGRSVPFHWPGLGCSLSTQGSNINCCALKNLPDAGYDFVLQTAVEQCWSRKLCNTTRSAAPNILSTISITVTPELRGRGLPAIILGEMKKTAIKHGLKALVAPLRPTLKHQYPFIDMSEYVTWTKHASKEDESLPFDPWLRTHVRLGARVIKEAPQSMLVEGTREQWTSWTGLDVGSALKHLDENDQVGSDPCKGPYTLIAFPGGLVPLKVYLERDWCAYKEPNIWVQHPLTSQRCNSVGCRARSEQDDLKRVSFPGTSVPNLFPLE